MPSSAANGLIALPISLHFLFMAANYTTGGHVVRNEEPQVSASDVSSFGFMNSDEGGSAFSFMQPAPVPVETTGFSFMSGSTETETPDVVLSHQPPTSSFSFLASDNNVASPVNLDDTAGLLSMHAPSGNVVPVPKVVNDVRHQETADLKLNATSLVKTVRLHISVQFLQSVPKFKICPQ